MKKELDKRYKNLKDMQTKIKEHIYFFTNIL